MWPTVPSKESTVLQPAAIATALLKRDMKPEYFPSNYFAKWVRSSRADAGSDEIKKR
jgi:hypothetical protein